MIAMEGFFLSHPHTFLAHHLILHFNIFKNMVCEIELSHIGKNGGNPDLVHMYKKRLYLNPLNTELTTMSLNWFIVHVLIKG